MRVCERNGLRQEPRAGSGFPTCTPRTVHSSGARRQPGLLPYVTHCDDATRSVLKPSGILGNERMKLKSVCRCFWKRARSVPSRCERQPDGGPAAVVDGGVRRCQLCLSVPASSLSATLITNAGVQMNGGNPGQLTGGGPHKPINHRHEHGCKRRHVRVNSRAGSLARGRSATSSCLCTTSNPGCCAD